MSARRGKTALREIRRRSIELYMKHEETKSIVRGIVVAWRKGA